MLASKVPGPATRSQARGGCLAGRRRSEPVLQKLAPGGQVSGRALVAAASVPALIDTSGIN